MSGHSFHSMATSSVSATAADSWHAVQERTSMRQDLVARTIRRHHKWQNVPHCRWNPWFPHGGSRYTWRPAGADLLALSSRGGTGASKVECVVAMGALPLPES